VSASSLDIARSIAVQRYYCKGGYDIHRSKVVFKKIAVADQDITQRVVCSNILSVGLICLLCEVILAMVQ
jgi:hypothetical protein